MSAPIYLTLQQLAERAHVTRDSMKVFHSRAKRRRAAGKDTASDVPEPDIMLGRTPGWSEETVEAWIEARRHMRGGIRE